MTFRQPSAWDWQQVEAATDDVFTFIESAFDEDDVWVLIRILCRRIEQALWVPNAAMIEKHHVERTEELKKRMGR